MNKKDHVWRTEMLILIIFCRVGIFSIESWYSPPPKVDILPGEEIDEITINHIIWLTKERTMKLLNVHITKCAKCNVKEFVVFREVLQEAAYIYRRPELDASKSTFTSSSLD